MTLPNKTAPTPDLKPHQTPYSVHGKVAIITGAGSGINLALAKLLLQNGSSVVFADLKLRPEAQETISQYPHPSTTANHPSAIFHQTNVADWFQLRSLFTTTLTTFGKVNIVVNGAASYEPPSSCFWNASGVSSLAKDDPDASIGVYNTFAVNLMGPVRLAQIAIDYWLANKDVEGSIFWEGSIGAYVHMMQTPFYFASKAGLMSMVKSLGLLRKLFGVRNAAICPGPVKSPLFEADYCKDRMLPGDLALTPERTAEQIYTILTQPQYGDGNVIELVVADGTTVEDQVITSREVPFETLYPKVTGSHMMEEEVKFVQALTEGGVRGWMDIYYK